MHTKSGKVEIGMQENIPNLGKRELVCKNTYTKIEKAENGMPQGRIYQTGRMADLIPDRYFLSLIFTIKNIT